MASDELTPETARELMSPLERGTLFVVDKDERDRILAQWTADRARLATVTAQRDALVGAAQECVEFSATMDSACPECFPDNDYGLRIEGVVCVYRLPHRSSSPNSLTAIAAERGKGEG